MMWHDFSGALGRDPSSSGAITACHQSGALASQSRPQLRHLALQGLALGALFHGSLLGRGALSGLLLPSLLGRGALSGLLLPSLLGRGALSGLLFQSLLCRFPSLLCCQ